jgi:hypothetical protein
MREVRKERTGWRCEAISTRHRDWGYNCPGVDLDFLVCEYNYGKPVALVEYKNRRYDPANTSDKTYNALRELADGYQGGALPLLIAVYDPADWWFVVHPLNARARAHYAHVAGQPITEQRFVRSLYLLRFKVIKAEDEAAIARLNARLPAETGAA